MTTEAILTVSKNVRCVLQPCSRSPANACESSEQPVRLVSAMWFQVPQSFTAFSLAYGRHLAWRPTCDSQQQWFLHHVSALATSDFEVCFPVKLYACC